MPGHALAPTGARLTEPANEIAGRYSDRLPPGDTLRCKRSLTVPEYQPDVHRLRLASSALARLTRSGQAFLRKP
jgi:hypothetical protein